MQTPDSWAREGEVLVAASNYGSADFERGLELLRKAADAGVAAAELTLGHVYSQVHLIPDAARQAADWYRRAAERGDPVAVNRLADLHMLGQGVPQDDTAALKLYRRNAERGYAVMQCNLAYMLGEGIGAAPDAAAAFGWYLSAAAQGEPRAYFELGQSFDAGWGITPDPVHAWAWMENARRQAYPDSAAELQRLGKDLKSGELAEAQKLAERIEANFIQLQQALQRAPEVLTSAERYRALVQENFAALGVAAWSLDPAKRPAHGAGTSRVHRSAAPVQFAERPRIFTVDEFVSRGESAHLMTLAGQNFKPADALTSDILSQENLAFTGHMSALRTVLCDAVVRQVERRVAAVFGLSPSHVEPLTVLRYQGGERYAPHVDYFDAARLSDNRRNGDQAGQRTASFLGYLRPAETGGETHYLEIRRKVPARARMALCHYNCLPSGEPDSATLHTGEPVQRGEKWLARTTLREKPFY
jgi:TPR repeat protein